MPPTICADCGTQVAPALLACPACHRLVHAERLNRLAADAGRAAAAGDLTAALAAWREALDLLPADTRQHATVAATISELSRRLDEGHSAAAPSGRKKSLGKRAAGISALGVLLAKFKFLVVFLLTKAKLLVLGLTKASTLFSMLLSAGVYWTLWGWKFAVGLVVSIYVHEMGHVQALNRYGIKATAPMFIPGIGAVVRLKQYPADPREDARVGLAGPIWGLGAAAAAYAAYLVTRAPVLAGIAHFGAWVNLFNLLPVWQLDGGRGFRALARRQRWIAVAVIAATWFATGEGLLALLCVAAVAAAWFGHAPEEPDAPALWQYASLVALLGAMTRIPVPVGTTG